MVEVQFKDDGLAHTLDADDVCEGHGSQTGHHARTHESRWTISGNICEDYYYWVNNFEAHHPDFGRVWGDFEDVVYADTEAGYEAFCAAHPAKVWDYEDI